MFKIFAWPGDAGGCGYYRMKYPLGELQKSGHKVTFNPNLATDIPDDEQPNLLFFQRAYNPQTVHFINAVARNQDNNSVKMVMDVDDDIWSIDEHNDAYDFYSDREVLDTLSWTMSQMDALIVTSDHLKKVVESHLHSYSKARVFVTPNAVPNRIVRPSDFPYEPQNGPLLLCWQGSPTHEGDLKEMVGPVSRYLMNNPGSMLLIIGMDYRDLFPVSIRHQIHYHGWVNGPDALHDTLRAYKPDVMLAPLKDTPFTAGKSNLRILEANGLGIPVIASAVGPYADGSPGTLSVTNRKEWYVALEAMEDVDTRKNLSIAGRAWVGSNHTQSVRTKTYSEIFTKILNP